ncbi:MAG: LysR family transcriptional regulator [Actinomycetota bacterium]
MAVDLELLRSFVAVAEEGHVGRAAARLYVSQPALTKRLHRLEEQVGASLLQRAGRGIELTEAGRSLADEASSIVATADAAVERARHVAGGTADQISIGFVAPMPHEITTDLLRAARDRPGPDVALRSLAWDEQLASVLAGAVDVALVRGPIEGLPEAGRIGDGLRCELLFEERRVAAFAVDHPRATEDVIELADLADEPIVAPEVNTSYWTVDPRPDGRSPRLGPAVSTVVEMLEVVASGQAMVLTAESVSTYYQRPDVAYVPVADLSPSTVHLVSGDPPTAAVAELTEEIRERSAPLRG